MRATDTDTSDRVKAVADQVVVDEACTERDKVPEPESPPRKRGRPKGTPKTGGRKKGSKNLASKAEQSERKDLIDEGSVFEFLGEVVAGKQFLQSGPTGKTFWAYPSLPERMTAAIALARKLRPDLKATEIVADVKTTQKQGHDVSDRQVARAILEMLHSANSDMAAVTELPSPEQEQSLDTWCERHSPPDGESLQVDTATEHNVGQEELIGERGISISLREIAQDKRERWSIYNEHSELIASVWGLEEARTAAEQLDKEGTISR